jgi:hypothetical protein
VKGKTVFLRSKRERLFFSFEHSVDARGQKARVEECTGLLDSSGGKLIDVWHMSYEKLVWLPDHKPSANATHARMQSTQ